MNKFYLGIDLGSTTSKAVIINEKDEILGRGITNTRANYKIAADIAKMEAIYDARFTLLIQKMESEIKAIPDLSKYIEEVRSVFNYLQFRKRLDRLSEQLKLTTNGFAFKSNKSLTQHIEDIINTIGPQIRREFIEGSLGFENQFFRDTVSECYNREVEKLNNNLFEPLMLAFDKSITPVENELMEFDFEQLVNDSMVILEDKYNGLADIAADNHSVNFDAELNLLEGNYKQVTDTFRKHIHRVADKEINISNMVGTGYGRALLPFPEDCIKSEILCHAFGAHAVFPKTRTVLDIGGQDTKAIQVDSYGLVTSFHMNDRCAAGCGRYLGYIADEMSISLNQLGSLALDSEKETNICSTCTVFAGAEVRELLNVGEKREDILAGLHKAIVMRAMSLIARSGGVRNEFTFTGGVARNQAVLKFVKKMVYENYGDNIKINIHHDSIFMGALGAAMFSMRNMKIDLPQKKKTIQNI